ncbi:MAG: hypothetical protein M9920_14365 [Verrucomicrobiae bacterium]|nr:hypothetical protein [Verrucomicrobiae bacterium]
MKRMTKRSFIGALTLAALVCSSIAVSAAPKTEAQLIADLASPKEKVVIRGLAEIEKNYPTSKTAQAAIKPLLTDNRKAVVRKAARVLGVVNADVTEAEIKSIAALLRGTDKYEIIDGLKALRGLKAQSAIPEITPLLKHSDKNVMRDSIRTLAVLGDRSLVPTIEPFMNFPDLAVQKDAADALAILKQK